MPVADTLYLEHVPCDLCGADNPEPVLTLTDRMFQTTDDVFQLVRCRGCDLLYLTPRPLEDALARYYPDSYAPFARRGLAARVKARQFRRTVRDLGQLVNPPARVLDIGCAAGDLLQAVREAGNPNVLGIEPSEHAAAVARARHGLEVVTGQLEDLALPGGSIDVVFMSHVIEHLPSPAQTLGEIARVLRPDGALVLWLPNADSLAARWCGEYWIGYDAPRHLYTFTVRTLSRLLDNQGFVVRDVRHERIGLEWSWALRLLIRDRLPRSRFNDVLAGFHPMLTALLSPISTASALAGKGGRIQVIARRAHI